MKTNKYLAAGVLAVLLVGCDKERLEYTAETEVGTVADLPYVPAGHGSTSSVGFTTSGDVSFSGGSVYIPERKAIVFECEHGRFVVEGHPDLWAKLKVGQKVTIEYHKIYKIVETDEGVVTKYFIDLDFINAVPIG